MRKTLRIVPLIALLSVFIGAPNAHADTTTTGTIKFTLTTCYTISPGYCNNPSAATGSFVYDNTSNTFTSFTVTWHSLLYDFTAVANSFADPSATGCPSLPKGNAFIEDLVCAPSTTGFPASNGLPVSWGGYSNADDVYSFTFFFATGSESYVENFANGLNDEIDYGTYTVNLTPSCQFDPGSVKHFLGPPLSTDGYPTSMSAIFRPTINGVPMTLRDAAKACNLAEFDWQQTITAMPCPSPFFAYLTYPNQCLLDGSLTAAPNYPTSDPPKGGYTIPEKYKGYDPSPFYYYSKPNAGFFDVLSEEQQPTGVVIDGRSLFVVTLDDKQLAYYDAPADSCLPGGDPTVCDGIADAPGSFLGFTTSLVGIDQNGVVLNPPLLTWNWTDTYNHTSGGISTTFNNQPVDPGGSGGVTITTINGVQLPSAVPPNQIAITASGLAYSRVTKTFNGTVTIQNTSGSPINGPFQIVFFGMPFNVTLANETGNLSGTPYLTVPGVASLAPGQKATVTVQFSNPQNKQINFTPVIYSGSFN